LIRQRERLLALLLEIAIGGLADDAQGHRTDFTETGNRAQFFDRGIQHTL